MATRNGQRSILDTMLRLCKLARVWGFAQAHTVGMTPQLAAAILAAVTVCEQLEAAGNFRLTGDPAGVPMTEMNPLINQLNALSLGELATVATTGEL